MIKLAKDIKLLQTMDTENESQIESREIQELPLRSGQTVVRTTSKTISDRLLSKKVREGVLIVVCLLLFLCTLYSTFVAPPSSQSNSSDAKQTAMLQALYKLATSIGGVTGAMHADGNEPV